MRSDRLISGLLALLLLIAAGCGSNDDEAANLGLGRPLKVVATTTIVGDVVRQVGRNRIELDVLLPIGASPHSYVPTPEDLVTVAEADIIFVNGLGLEQFLDEMIAQSGSHAEVVSVSNGIRARTFLEKSNILELAETEKRVQAMKEGVSEPDSLRGEMSDGEADRVGGDPHVWMNPHNVMVWAANIQEAFGHHDPANGEYYAEKAQWYKSKLSDIDGRIMTLVEKVPPLKRRLVTGHMFLGYFADRYSFTQVGTIMPSPSSQAEPSAKSIARLEELVRRMKVPAIFASHDLDPTMAKQIADDIGVELRLLYVGSLSEPGYKASNYIDYMEYNIGQIVEGLVPEEKQAAPEGTMVP